MSTPFDELRTIVSKISKKEDIQKNLVPVIMKMSEINELYIDISQEKDRLMLELQSITEQTRNKQIECEESIHNCQLQADKILADPAKQIDLTGIQLTPMEQFMEKTGLSEADIESYTENELYQKRLEYDIQQLPDINQKYDEVKKKKEEVEAQLSVLKQRYAKIAPEIQKLYDRLAGLAPDDI